MTTIHTLLSIASIKGWHLHQLDINIAFLHGTSEGEVYMTTPLALNPPPNILFENLTSPSMDLNMTFVSGIILSPKPFTNEVLLNLGLTIPCLLNKLN